MKVRLAVVSIIVRPSLNDGRAEDYIRDWLMVNRQNVREAYNRYDALGNSNQLQVFCCLLA